MCFRELYRVAQLNCLRIIQSTYNVVLERVIQSYTEQYCKLFLRGLYKADRALSNWKREMAVSNGQPHIYKGGGNT